MAPDALETRMRDRVADLAALVEAEMASVLEDVCQSKPMRDGAMYAALGGGKRLRPALTLMCAAACGGDTQAALPGAAAIELVHAFSLVHDDLPCMDDDDLRRGRPTLHVHAGESAALLAGDAMLNAAYWTLARRVPDATMSARLTLELAEASARMIDGQTLDTLGGFDPAVSSDADRLRVIHEWKTGALLRAACRMGALSATASEDELAAITAYADAVGLMFQIVDDLIDVEQSTEQAGKRTGKDAEAGKLTFPGVLGVDASRSEVAKLLDASLAAVDPLGPRGEELADLARVLAARTR
ncbi:MAG: polyprenyl synthetase family protein [Phycisphaerales bacterium]